MDNITFTYQASNLALGTHSLAVQGMDEAGNQTGLIETSFTVTNIGPVVDAGPNQTTDEGSIFTLSQVTFTDANGVDTHTAVIDWGDGVVEDGVVVESEGEGIVTGSHVYQDDDGGPFTVTITVTDDSGIPDSDTLEVAVNNVPPVLDVGDDRAVDPDVEMTLDSVTFSDASSVDTHSAFVVWGDGSNDVGEVDQAAGTISQSHVYDEDGVFTVTIVVMDDDGGSDIGSFDVTVGTGVTRPDESDIRIFPTTLDETLAPDQASSLTFTISNLGTTVLAWDITDPLEQPWLSISPTIGSTPPGANTQIQVDFDSTGLPADIHATNLRVSSNDPDNPLLLLPITLTVTGPTPTTVYGAG